MSFRDLCLCAMFRCVMFLLLSCGNSKEFESFGVKTVALEFSTADLADLQAATFDEVKYPADVYIDGRRSRALAGFTGRTSVDAFKKSWQVSTATNSFRLAAAIEDRSAVRTIFGYQVFAMLGLPVPKVEPVVVYVNGVYSGLYTMVEPLNAQFFANRGIANPVAYKAHHSNHDLDGDLFHNLETAFSDVTGTEAWVDLEEFIAALNNEQAPDAIRNHLNLESFYTYLVGAVLLNHWDGMENNYVLYRSGSERDFKVAPWDMDATLGEDRDVSQYGEGNFARQVLSSAVRRSEYRQMVAVALQKIDWAKLDRLLTDLVESLTPAFTHDPVLSANLRTMSYEVSVLKTRFEVRRISLQAFANQ